MLSLSSWRFGGLMGTVWLLLAFGVGLLLLYVLAMLLVLPLKWLGRLIISSAIGFAVLVVLNLIGSLFGFTLALNPINALIVGVLGVPGVLMLIVFRLFL